MIMRRLAQFVRLHLSRVYVRLLMLRVPNARVCVYLSRVCVCICLASAHVKGSECSRLCASVHVKGSECVRLLMLRVPNARVCVHLSRVCVCVRLFAFVSRLLTSVCVCICLASVSRLCASVRVCVRLLASVSRLCASGVLSRVGRLVSRVCASACGNWLILCVSHHSKSSKVGGTGSGFCYMSRVILSPCLLSYNVPMLKYPSHHLIYVFYHPMPIMPLY